MTHGMVIIIRTGGALTQNTEFLKNSVPTSESGFTPYARKGSTQVSKKMRKIFTGR